MSALAYQQTDTFSAFTLRDLAQDIKAKRNEPNLNSDEIDKKVEAFKAAYNYHKRENKLDLPPLSTTDKILSIQEEFFREKYEKRSKIVQLSTPNMPTRQIENGIEQGRIMQIEAERDRLKERVKELENDRDREKERIQSIENQRNTMFADKGKIEVESRKNLLDREAEIAQLKKQIETLTRDRTERDREIENQRERIKNIEIEKNQEREKVENIESKRHELLNAKGEVEIESRKMILELETEIEGYRKKIQELNEAHTALEITKKQEIESYETKLKKLETYNKKWERIEKASGKEIFLKRYGMALFITICLILVQSNEAKLFAELAFKFAQYEGIWIPFVAAFLGFGFQVLGLFLTVNRNKVTKPIIIGYDAEKDQDIYLRNEKNEIQTEQQYSMTTMQVFCFIDSIINLIVLFGKSETVELFSFQGLTLVCFSLIPPLGIYFSSEILLNILDKREKLLATE